MMKRLGRLSVSAAAVLCVCALTTGANAQQGRAAQPSAALPGVPVSPARSEMAHPSARLEVGTSHRDLRRLARPRVDIEPQSHHRVGRAREAPAVLGRAWTGRQLAHHPRHVRRSQRFRLDERAREQPDGEIHPHGSGARSSIGKFDETGGSNDTALMGRPAEIWADPADNEVFIADGYGNRRIIVFDGATGNYLRHWGVYGKRPEDPPARGGGAGGGAGAGGAAGELRRAVAEREVERRRRVARPRADAHGGRRRWQAREGPVPAAPPQQLSVPHGIAGSRDGLIYLADRANNRIQAFRQNGEYVARTNSRPRCGAAGTGHMDTEATVRERSRVFDRLLARRSTNVSLRGRRRHRTSLPC